MNKLYEAMVGVGGKIVTYPITVFLLSVAHYAFAGMHTSFELFMYVFHRKKFEMNMIEIEKQLEFSRIKN